MIIGVIRIKLFIDRLIEKVEQKNSHVCVGLDPHLDLMPHFIFKQSKTDKNSNNSDIAIAVTLYNKIIIDHIADIAVAVKPQMAFYELLGNHGLVALEDTVNYARKKGLIVILDGKRNDIGSTARAYSAAYLSGNHFNPYHDNSASMDEGEEMILGDALTVNPYLGYDGIKPFLQRNDKGAFSLVRTSNESAGNLQDLELKNGHKLYQQVGEYIEQWGRNFRGENGYSNLGAVVGATYPRELKYLRKAMPHTYFLIPGYGVQGGTASDIAYGFDTDKQGALINSARGIIFAYTREPWKEKFSESEFGPAARMAAKKMRDEINEILEDRC